MQDFWQNFKEYRLSEEYLELSRKNKENSQKAMNLIISALVATPKRCQNLKQNFKRWIALLRKAFRLRPPIGSPDQYYTVWGEMYGMPRTGALDPQINP